MDGFAQLVVERETMVDPVAIAIWQEAIAAGPGEWVRPGEDAVPALQAPDLDRDDVRLRENVRPELRILDPWDLDVVVADECGAHYAVDVADQSRLLCVQRLRPQ